MRRASVLLLAALLSCGEKKMPSGIDFAAYGDARHEPPVHRRIVNAIAGSGAKFVLVTGDLVDYAEDEAEWLEVRDILKDLRSRAKYYCAVGDHDPGEKKYFEREMGEPRMSYDVREGDYHLFILDSRAKFTDGPQLEWLKKTAGASTAKHKFAVFHHPPFMIYEKRMQEADVIRPNIHPLLVELKFCAAFCGHQHAFYSTKRDGLRYVVTAGGGAPLRNIDVAHGLPGALAREF